jgi:hypothetical protein
MSALLYQLTASAAHMCLPVPVPAAAPDGWLEPLVRRIDHWQTLGGNIVGGAMGITGALIVAVMVRSRERRIAAGMVLPDLLRLAATGKDVARHYSVPKPATASRQARLQEDPARETARISVIVSALKMRRPPLLALHTAVLGQLTDVDTRLSNHLFQCEMAHRLFEDNIDAYRSPKENVIASLVAKEPDALTKRPPSGPLIYADWQRAVEHATLAAYYLELLVFSSWPRWVQRLRMKRRPNELDRRSAHLITTGEPLAQQPAGASAPAQA